MRAYAGTAVAATAKHFPGLGAATANTDDVPVTIARAARTLGATDLPPFRAAIAAGVAARDGLPRALPGARSERDRVAVAAVVTGLLKQRLGFRGVVVTDSLEAEAVRARMGPGAPPCAPSGPASTSCSPPARAATCGCGAPSRREARRDPRFRARLAGRRRTGDRAATDAGQACR